jgi:hypothetical protein
MYNNNDDSYKEKEFITATVMSIVSSIDAQIEVNDERYEALQKTLRFEVCEEAYGGSDGEGSYDPERAARIVELQGQLRVAIVTHYALHDERDSVLHMQWW